MNQKYTVIISAAALAGIGVAIAYIYRSRKEELSYANADANSPELQAGRQVKGDGHSSFIPSHEEHNRDNGHGRHATHH